MIMRVITFVSDDGYNVDVTGEFVELKSEYHSNKYGTRPQGSPFKHFLVIGTTKVDVTDVEMICCPSLLPDDGVLFRRDDPKRVSSLLALLHKTLGV